MQLEELTIPLQKIRGIGPAGQKALHEYGIRSVRDLLWHLPKEYQDRTRRIGLRAATQKREGAWINTVADVVSHEWFGSPPRKTLKILVDDGESQAVLVCFGRDFLSRQMPPGTRLFLYGFAQYRFREIQIAQFETEPVPADTPEPGAFEDGTILPTFSGGFGKVLPVYPLTGNLTQAFFRRTLSTCVDAYARNIDDPLPKTLVSKYGLMSRSEAIHAVHMPPSADLAVRARERLVYEELFLLQTSIVDRLIRRGGVLPRNSSGENNRSPGRLAAFETSLGKHARNLLSSLPFDLTDGQKHAVLDILQDLRAGRPLSRLIQGDVGSGKTLVALFAAVTVIETGAQAALMVPTVLLAHQHAEKAAALLEPLGIRVALLAGTIAAPHRRPLVEAVERGDADLVIGTHALFSAGIRYSRLGLVIIDEQHRFGVKQRKALFGKADQPNLLMMSATPIPQTLAMTLFGDMEVSVIDGLPAHRRPIETHLARMGNEQKVYEWVRRELAKGKQAYFVYPLIEGEGPEEMPEARKETGSAAMSREGRSRTEMESGNESAALKNAEAMYEDLRTRIFPDHAIGMIHSRLPDERKDSVMDDFSAGRLGILVATSVVEVGVDVPNATCMVIEHAERFGLAALHQLRGRVGRGKDQSYCFLVYQEPLSEESKSRLKVLKETSDGFLIAEEDLRIRGPGDLRGIQQSGFVRLKIADLVRDAAIMVRARADALSVFGADPHLERPEHSGLAEVMAVLRQEPTESGEDQG